MNIDFGHLEEPSWISESKFLKSKISLANKENLIIKEENTKQKKMESKKRGYRSLINSIKETPIVSE